MRIRTTYHLHVTLLQEFLPSRPVGEDHHLPEDNRHLAPQTRGKASASPASGASAVTSGKDWLSAKGRGSKIIEITAFPRGYYPKQACRSSGQSLRVMERPRPKPSASSVSARRVNSPNIRSCSSFGMPGPGIADGN